MERNYKYDYELNRRLTFRLSIHLPTIINVRICVGDVQVAVGRAADIALGGISLIIQDPLPTPIQQCRAHFVLPFGHSGYEFDMRCELVHITEIAGRTICGLEFLDILEPERMDDYCALWNFIAAELEKRHPHLCCDRPEQSACQLPAASSRVL